MANPNHYTINQQVKCSIAFTVAGVATDPTTVVFVFKDPSGTKTTYISPASQIIKDSVGNYHVDLTVAKEGYWYYGFYGTGAVIAAAENHFIVDPSQVF